MSELVVLLDADGAPTGTADKVAVHHADTPLHLAFSCYVFDADGRLLVSQRALAKRVFPGLWTNSCCGHPAPGESLTDAVRRRSRDELGLELRDVRLVLPDFAYRAQMQGIVEHEMCPVVVATLADGARVERNPDEVEATDWVAWPQFADDVRTGAFAVSPWCAMQVEALTALGAEPTDWPTAPDTALPPALN